MTQIVFLSDLCGREVLMCVLCNSKRFLSDLCGREVIYDDLALVLNFLSDLCGREGTHQSWHK